MTVIIANSPYVCGWSVDDACSPTLAGANEDVALRCVTVAAEVLYALSGRQFGLCETTVRPCRLRCSDGLGSSGYRWTPVQMGGQWANVGCGSCARDNCSCTEVRQIRLPGPVAEVTGVVIDGVDQDLDNYRVDNGYAVLRADGAWPVCQDMNLPSTEVGTYEITYLKGRPLPVSGEAALAEFAVELCKSCLDDSTCALPKRVTTIQRQGVTMALLDPMSFINEGKTGLFTVDSWLQAMNPKARTRSAGVFSPDMPQMRKTTWP